MIVIVVLLLSSNCNIAFKANYRTLRGRDQREKCTLNFIKYTLSRPTASSTTKSALLHRKECFIRSILFTLRSSSITRGHDLKIYKPHATCLPHRHFYSVRIINDWNGLPYDSVNVHSTNLFKTHLDRFYYDYQYDIV